jgi:hypothetical protein
MRRRPSTTFRKPGRRLQAAAVHARSRTENSLDCGRVSHLGMDDQSIRSKGETLRPIERLAGSGHCMQTPRPRSPAAAPDEGRRSGMRVMTKATPAPTLVERERAAMIDELSESELPKITAC